MKKTIQFCFVVLLTSIVNFSNAQVVGSMSWIKLDSQTHGACSSNTDCDNDLICYGLSYTPGATGVVSDYTTGFIINCVGAGNPVFSNSSCIMNDNSNLINACPNGVLFNSSGNTGTTSYDMGTAYIIHQVCFTIASGETINIIEDETTNLTTNINLPGGGSVTDEPAYISYDIIKDDVCVTLDGIFVDESATGTNDGSSWENAFTDLQDALAIGSNMNIHIAEGTYLPTPNTSRGIFFDVPSDATLLGGYPTGGGTRDASLYTTILSGEIDGIAGHDGNSFHVVRLQDVTGVTIDGLEIAEGSADNAASFARSRGGGIFSKGSTATFINTTIRDNNAVFGGAIFATLSPIVVFNGCTMSQNVAGNGGAIYHSNETNLYINNSYIIDNNSTIRCAIEINNSLYTEINNSIIANNASKNANAIGFIATNRDQSCNIYNSTILGETKNKNLLSLQIGNNDVLDVNIYNSIIAHQNAAFDKSAVAYNNGTLNLNTSNCYIQGATFLGNTTNNLYEDNVGPVSYGLNYAPGFCSPTVNAGNNANTNSLTTDSEGYPRIVDFTVDIGAHEAQVPCAPQRGNMLSDINLSIFPNPTSEMVFIKTDLETFNVKVFDISGKVVAQSNTHAINLGKLPLGIYIVNVESNGQLLRTDKIIKQ